MLYNFFQRPGFVPARSVAESVTVEVEATVARHLYETLAEQMEENGLVIEAAAYRYFDDNGANPALVERKVQQRVKLARCYQKEAQRMAETMALCTGNARFPLAEAHVFRHIRNGEALAYWLQTEPTR